MLKKFRKLILVFLIAVFLIGGSFGAGFWFGQDEQILTSRTTQGGVGDLVRATEPKGVDFFLLWEAWEIVNQKYYGENDSKKRVEGAIAGMVDSLDDPYTIYLEPSANKLYLADLEGHFDGIGAELSLKNSLITVVAPLQGSPSEKAGLKAQDVIIKVDGEETDKLSFNDAILKIRGKKGTEVTLTVFRPSANEELEIKVIRDTIEIKSVELEFKGENESIAVLKINQFGEDTINLIKIASKTIIEKKSDKIIVDLRNNPGGLLSVAIDATSLFLADDLSSYQDETLIKGVVVSEEGKNQKKKDYLRTNKQLFNQEMVIFQNGGSASASEIFAGAIKDYGRGEVIGEKSFGKGSVQTLMDLSNNGSIKVTIAKWLTPKGSQINGIGIEPDVIIKEEENKDVDKFIEKAIEILNT